MATQPAQLAVLANGGDTMGGWCLSAAFNPCSVDSSRVIDGHVAETQA